MAERAPFPCDCCGGYYSDNDIWTNYDTGNDEYIFCQSCTYTVLGPEAVYKPPTWEEQKARWDEINEYRESKGLFKI